VTRQVRIDDDLAALLIERAAPGQSLSASANDVLRSVLVATPAKRPSLSVGGRNAKAVSATSGCKHPIGRRIGNWCAVCGSAV